MATVVESLAAFASALTYETLPPAVVAKAKASLVHNLACALAARGLVGPALQMARLQSEGSGWAARTLEGGHRVAPADAAFANGALMHARAQDDFHKEANAHPGTVIIPAALALADATGASGRDLLVAVVAGYEVLIAAGAAFSARSTPRGFRSTGVYGPLGSAAAAARILRLDAAATASALALAASFAGGLTQPWLSGTFEFWAQAGEASRAGVAAALLARAGLRGAPEALEGDAGFCRAFSGGVEGLETVTAGLGERWRIQGVSFKFFPISGIMQVPTHTAVALAREHGVAGDQIESVHLEMNRFEYNYPGTAHPGRCPDVSAALMSARYCLAAALRHGGVAYRHLQEVDDPGQAALMARIQVEPADDLPHLSCRLTLRLRGGRVVQGERTGGLDLVWDVAAAEALARSLEPEAGLPPGQMDHLIAAVHGLESGPAGDLLAVAVQ